MSGAAAVAVRPRRRLAFGAGTGRARRASVPGTIYGHGSRRVWTWIAVDALAVLALALLAAIGWSPAFGNAEVFVATLGGAALGILVASVSALRRWGVLTTAALTAAAYFAFGSALAMPSQATARVLPTARTLTQLAQAPVTVWRDVLVIAPPIGETGAMLAAPLIVALLAAVAAVSVGLRSGRGALAFLPSLAAIVVAFAFGTSRPNFPIWVGAAILLIIVPWAASRHASVHRELVGAGPRIAWTRVALGALVLALAVGTAVAVAPSIRPLHRGVLRELVQPPLDLRDYPSPLQGYRANLTDHKTDVLFHVDNLPAGAKVRLATLDSYDGFTAGVANTAAPGSDSGAFQRVGTKVPLNEAGAPVDASVTIAGYTGPWVPTIGDLSSVRFTGQRRDVLTDDLYYNPASGTALTTAALRSGDTYHLTALMPQQPSQADLAHLNAASVNLPVLGAVPDQVADLATRYTANAQGAGDAALKIERALKQGYFSDGLEGQATSPAGHSAGRLRTLLSADLPMIGDEEQYAVAMMLIARTAGLPARVVYGYASKGSGSVDVTGADVSAWVEIKFDNAGWVTFNPTPDHSRVYKDQTPPDENHPRPQVQNPPPPPQKPDALPPDNTSPQQPKPPEKPKINVDWSFVGRLVAGIGIPVVLIVVPILTIVGMKLRRRRRRAADPSMGARLVGGWAEVVDRARDLGARLPIGQTRTEQAASLLTQFAELDSSVDAHGLAHGADAGAFAPEEQDPSLANAYWAGVQKAVAGMRRSRPRWRRARAWLSLASLRRAR